jgi:hypothetical protein
MNPDGLTRRWTAMWNGEIPAAEVVAQNATSTLVESHRPTARGSRGIRKSCK